MSSPYCHQHHAGNFADVHKHWLLGLTLEQLVSDPAPLQYLETHAGGGLYRYKKGDKVSATSGVARLWSQQPTAPGLKHYLERVREFNPDGNLNYYPGSPLVAAMLLRQSDSAILVEQEEEVFDQLKLSLTEYSSFNLHCGDGLKLVTSLLPRKERWLLLIDPPFTESEEFIHLAEWLPQLLQDYPHGVIALWYPVTTEGHHLQLLTMLARRIATPSLTSEFHLAQKKHGMYGCGVQLFNPPPALAQRIQQEGGELAKRLGGVIRLT